MKVTAKAGAYLTVHYYNTNGDDKAKDLKLVWWRQNPKAKEEDYEEVYQDTLSPAQVKGGFSAWQEEIHSNLFYQKVIGVKDLIKKPGGYELKRLKRSLVKRAKPLVPQ